MSLNSTTPEDYKDEALIPIVPIAQEMAKKYYVRENTKMAVVTNLPVDDIIKELEKFKDYKKGEKAIGEKFDFPYENSVF